MQSKIDSRKIPLSKISTHNMLAKFKSKNDLYQYISENVSTRIYIIMF